jgi:hypothetical protein
VRPAMFLPFLRSTVTSGQTEAVSCGFLITQKINNMWQHRWSQDIQRIKKTSRCLSSSISRDSELKGWHGAPPSPPPRQWRLNVSTLTARHIPEGRLDCGKYHLCPTVSQLPTTLTG